MQNKEMLEDFARIMEETIATEGVENTLKEVGVSTIQNQTASHELFSYIIAIQEILFRKNIVSKEEMETLLQEVYTEKAKSVEKYLKNELEKDE